MSHNVAGVISKTMSALRMGLCPSLSEHVYSSLRDAGVKTVTDFIVSDLEMLSQKTEISYKVNIRAVTIHSLHDMRYVRS